MRNFTYWYVWHLFYYIFIKNGHSIMFVCTKMHLSVFFSRKFGLINGCANVVPHKNYINHTFIVYRAKSIEASLSVHHRTWLIRWTCLKNVFNSSIWPNSHHGITNLSWLFFFICKLYGVLELIFWCIMQLIWWMANWVSVAYHMCTPDLCVSGQI